MKIKQLVWEQFANTGMHQHVAWIEGWGTQYSYWYEPKIDKYKVSGIDRHHTTHESATQAKAFCQADFEKKVREFLIED